MDFDQEKTQDVAGQGCEQDYRDMRASAGKDGRFSPVRENCAGQLGRALSEKDILAELFSYHPPTPVTLPKFAAINQAAKNFAEVVLQNCPRGADRADVIRSIQDARMVANRSIALDGLAIT
jgi:hypothetical protein